MKEWRKKMSQDCFEVLEHCKQKSKYYVKTRTIHSSCILKFISVCVLLATSCLLREEQEKRKKSLRVRGRGGKLCYDVPYSFSDVVLYNDNFLAAILPPDGSWEGFRCNPQKYLLLRCSAAAVSPIFSSPLSSLTVLTSCTTTSILQQSLLSEAQPK